MADEFFSSRTILLVSYVAPRAVLTLAPIRGIIKEYAFRLCRGARGANLRIYFIANGAQKSTRTAIGGSRARASGVVQ